MRLDVAASGISSTKAAKPTVMKGRLKMSLGNCVPVEELVEPEVAGEMQRGVEEGVEAEHAPQADRARPSRKGGAAA